MSKIPVKTREMKPVTGEFWSLEFTWLTNLNKRQTNDGKQYKWWPNILPRPYRFCARQLSSQDHAINKYLKPTDRRFWDNSKIDQSLRWGKVHNTAIDELSILLNPLWRLKIMMKVKRINLGTKTKYVTMANQVISFPI